MQINLTRSDGTLIAIELAEIRGLTAERPDAAVMLELVREQEPVKLGGTWETLRRVVDAGLGRIGRTLRERTRRTGRKEDADRVGAYATPWLSRLKTSADGSLEVALYGDMWVVRRAPGAGSVTGWKRVEPQGGDAWPWLDSETKTRKLWEELTGEPLGDIDLRDEVRTERTAREEAAGAAAAAG